MPQFQDNFQDAQRYLHHLQQTLQPIGFCVLAHCLFHFSFPLNDLRLKALILRNWREAADNSVFGLRIMIMRTIVTVEFGLFCRAALCLLTPTLVLT